MERVFLASEDAFLVGFLRFVAEDENDFALRVDFGVVVVVIFGRGDAVASEDDGALGFAIGA